MKKIMIVDDEQDIRELLVRYLKMLFNGLKATDKALPEFIEACDASQAWLMLVQEKIIPDLMIVDFQMPGMNGDQLIVKIRDELDLRPEIVLHSDHFLAEDRAQEIGCHFVPKGGGEKIIFNLALESGIFSP